ncbi:MAG: MBL fold metallo-hydrolase [Lachnospiraceae bacterium]|nr:MBL fold metallo-hydrolase [Lachnospiraceae bacterium]
MDKRGALFGRWKVRESTWMLTNRWLNMMYLLEGENMAALIDTGYGEGNIRQYAESVTDKPVIVICTHGHMDHTGGNGWWPRVYMAPEGARASKEFLNKEQKLWWKYMPYQDYEIVPVKDGDKIDLGGRVLEILTIPAHHESSIAILDQKERLLFTGDELESGQVLYFVRDVNLPYQETAQAHLNNMEKLYARRKEYDALCPAHNGAMLDPDTYILDFMELDRRLIAGTANLLPDEGGFGWGPDSHDGSNPFFDKYGVLRRAEYGQASVVYEELPK